jgi:GTP-binding protein
VHAFEVINGELAAFSESLTQKPMIVVATKLDATTDRTRLDALRKFCKKRHLEFHAISAVAGEGVRDLVRSIADALDKIPRAIPEPAGAEDSLPTAVKVDPSARRAAEDGDS